MVISNQKALNPKMASAFAAIRSALAIAPHPGDDVFGCGGTLSLLHASGSVVTTIIVSAGDVDAANVRNEPNDVVAEESRAAARLLGLSAPSFWGLSKRNTEYGELLIERFTKAILETNADLVFLPSPTGLARDHQAVGFAAGEAVRRLGGGRQAAFYEIDEPLPCPNLIHDISSTEEGKLAAMRCFRSLLEMQPYDVRVSGMNSFRAFRLGAMAKSAEAFTVLTAADLNKGVSTLLEGSPNRKWIGDLAREPGGGPLVSVIIRSMDRPTLSDALDSIALQTYPNIEVVLVNAGGAEHQEIEPWTERFPVRLIGTGARLHRTQAANVGLDAARGQYLMFLDDDDWIEASHIQKLVTAIEQNTEFKAIYTGVKCVDQNKDPLPNHFDTPFDATQMIAGNFIPIHAVLFSRDFLELGCRLDETLDLYEDWDFWIQLSRYGNFLKIDGLSAVYRITPQTGFGVRADPVVAERAALVLHRKWISRLTDTELTGLMFAVRNNRAKDDQIAELHQAVTKRDDHVRHLDAQVGQLDQSRHEREARINDLDAQITRLGQTVQSKELQIADLLVQQVATSNQAAAERIESNERMLRFEHAMGERNQLIQEQANTIAALHGSRSWRVTRPLRYVGRLWRGLRSLRAMAGRLLQRHSLAALSRKLLAVLRRDGIGGVRALVRRHRDLAAQEIGRTPHQAPAAPGVALEQAAIVRDLQGHYALAATSNGYTYIEPQRPLDLDARIARLATTAVFSIVVPIYNTPPLLLKALLASVHGQWYAHWNLVLVDDASPAQETRQALSQISHPQIKLLKLEKNQGIAGATNAALEVADGDFIVFLDHDDELTVDCLYELAQCIDRDQPDYIYSDEDKLTERGEYCEPHFKPDWSPDTMMSTMFTCHVSCVRRSLLQQVGGLRSEYDGCQDWDFVLRVSEQTDRISHIPKVLYHWRIIPGSTAADISAKSYILDASQAVRKDALIRRGLIGTIEPIVQVPGYFRVAYHLQGNPLVSIVIPTRDNEAVLRRCVDSIRQRTSGAQYELVILDNGSVDPLALGYLQQLGAQDGVTVVRHDAPFNFSELNNIGARAAAGELLLFLNDDTEVLQADWLDRLGGFAQLAHVGAVGAKLLYPGNTEIQHAGVLNLGPGPMHAFLRQASDSPGYYMRGLLEYNWLAVTGACLMVARDKFDAVKGFNESLPVAYNDVDLCMRLHDAGFYNVVCQAVRLTHHESASRGLDHLDPEKWARLMHDLALLYERNPRYFQHDPFHNPNLHPNGSNFEVAA